jgi:hypothetical protein
MNKILKLYHGTTKAKLKIGDSLEIQKARNTSLNPDTNKEEPAIFTSASFQYSLERYILRNGWEKLQILIIFEDKEKYHVEYVLNNRKYGIGAVYELDPSGFQYNFELSNTNGWDEYIKFSDAEIINNHVINAKILSEYGYNVRIKKRFKLNARKKLEMANNEVVRKYNSGKLTQQDIDEFNSILEHYTER